MFVGAGIAKSLLVDTEYFKLRSPFSLHESKLDPQSSTSTTMPVSSYLLLSIFIQDAEHKVYLRNIIAITVMSF